MRYLLLLFACLVSTNATAQMPHQPSAAEIHQKIKKLNVLGNVLYLAAHPDDENTRFIAYAANELLFDTAYLSLTRGDGGQNLVGPEIREELGIIRTQELLQARRTDGGTQYFTRANDFGYSKTPEETLEIWDKKSVLSDVVRVIREFRPDVIVCRFPTDGGGGHGHHTASAVLGLEAFNLAGDPLAFPEQLETLEVWQPTRIVVNTGRWWKTDISADDPGVVAIDVGAYNKALGTSYNELAARSRTMHKSQGFGATGTRGEQIEFFEHLGGLEAKDSLFEGIFTDWSRAQGGSMEIWNRVGKLAADFDIERPEKSIPGLVDIRDKLLVTPDTDGDHKSLSEYWQRKKGSDVEELIKDCAGLYLEAVASDYWAAPGESISIAIEMVARGFDGADLVGYDIPALGLSAQESKSLPVNQMVQVGCGGVIPAGTLPSQPYWLKDAGTLGTYRVDDPGLIGTPENEPAIEVDLHLRFRNVGQGNAEPLYLTYRVPLVYKWNDPVQGELYRSFVITPPVFVTFAETSHLFTGDAGKDIEIEVKAIEAGYEGMLQLQGAPGWQITPESLPLAFETKGEERTVTVRVTPLENAQPFELKAVTMRNGVAHGHSLREIIYDHIPNQVYMPEAKSRMVYVDIQKNGQRIGYIPGAGDSVPTALRGVGYTVDELTEADITTENLAKYDAVLTGIRLLNVDDRIGFYMPRLLEYCEAGGTLVLQYNTRHALKTGDFSPYPLTLSRDRVTEEDAEVRFLLPDHPVLNTPNKLSLADFDGWVQERGLYFPKVWDDSYSAILSWNDKGEEARDGSLLVAEYGKGHYVYTGISFFRELPAGVPGAYRLLVNLLSLGND